MIPQEEINTGNRIIAEHFDAKKAGTDEGLTFFTGMDYDITGMGHGFFEHLRFHEDWNLLMPIVAKVTELFDPIQRDLSNRSREQEHLEDPHNNPLHWKGWSTHQIKLSTDIVDVWKQVVTSLTWYRKHHPHK